MLKTRLFIGTFILSVLVLISCQETEKVEPISENQEALFQNSTSNSAARMKEHTGVLTANGWYEEEEIYYINHGIEEGVTERGKNQIYLIGGDRLHQANVVLFIPGEPGYSPHWNVNLVQTTPGTTVKDILMSPYASAHFDDEGVLFDDVQDILGAADAGLVTIAKPGVVVNCPIISEEGAESPGNTELSEEFEPFDLYGGF